MFRKFILVVAITIGLAVVSPTIARADFILSLSSGGQTSYVDLTTGKLASGFTSSGSLTLSGYSSSGTLGQGTFIAGFETLTGAITFNGFTINAEVATTNTPGALTGGTLELQSLTVTNNNASASTLTISVTSTGYEFPSPQSNLTLTATALYNSPMAGASVTAATYYDSTNSDFGESGSVASATSASGGTGLSGVTVSTLLPKLTSSNYSITDVLALNNMGSGQTLGTGEVLGTVTAPAPSGLILAVTMMPFFGLIYRRLRTMNNAATV